MSKRTLLSMLFAWLVPGGGHFYLGKRTRAVVFFVVVIFMFVMGLWLDGRLYAPEQGKPLTLFAALASMGTGIPYFIARAIGTFGNVNSITFEYGTAFSLTAGLMNLLCVLDSFDISEGRKE